MMMRMLGFGGLEILTDGIRGADASNPLGYFEHEGTKRLKEGDHAWLDGAPGKVVKVVSPLLELLPPTHRYQVIFMVRSLSEVLASQARMLERAGTDRPRGDEPELAEAYRQHLRRVRSWMNGARNVDVLYVRHRDVIDDARSVASTLQAFLGRPLDRLAMVDAIERSLYRERSEDR